MFQLDIRYTFAQVSATIDPRQVAVVSSLLAYGTNHSARVQRRSRTAPMISGGPLNPDEEAFVDAYSGTTPNPDALEQSRAKTRRALATTEMPDLPCIETVRAALTTADEYAAVRVTCFVDNARIVDPGSGEELTVRQWLELGRDPEVMIALADSLNYSN